MEYAIWGIPAGRSEETLLVSMPGGKPITSRAVADKLAIEMRSVRFGARSVRVQELDMSVVPDFGATVN